MTIDELITELYDLRDQRAALNKSVVELTTVIEDKSKELIDRIKDTGLKSVTGSKARATINEEHYPHIVDWDAFMATDEAKYMVQKRVSTRPFEEYLNAYGEAPQGLASVAITKLSFTKI